MSTVRKYIIVDDDPINNILCNITIESILGKVDIKTFEIPEESLLYIKNEHIESLESTILLLDINMPTLTGWEFMEQFEQFSEHVKKQFNIYMVSSSVDKRDSAKARANRYIKDFVSKPLTKEIILSMAGS